MPASNDNIEGHTQTFWLRVETVVEIIIRNRECLKSKRAESLVEMVKEKLSVEDRMAKEYIKYAKPLVRKKFSDDSKEALKDAILDREGLLLDAETVNEKLAIMKDRDDLKNLYTTKIKETGEVTVKNVEMSQFTEYGLEKLKRGEKLEDVLLDPKSLKRNADSDSNSSRS